MRTTDFFTARVGRGQSIHLARQDQGVVDLGREITAPVYTACGAQGVWSVNAFRSGTYRLEAEATCKRCIKAGRNTPEWEKFTPESN